MLDLGNGNPEIFNQWWFKQHNIRSFSFPHISAPVMNYEENHPLYLEQLIKEFRQETLKYNRNQDIIIDKRRMVFGTGSTQVIHAILLVLAKKKGDVLTVTMQTPYYMLMKDLIEATSGLKFVYNPSNEDKIDVEIVVSPNNPTGYHNEPSVNARYTIYDHAYDWPMYTSNVINDSNESISIFTSSKLFGCGGFRIGWGLFKDDNLAMDTQNMLNLMSVCPNSYGLIALTGILQQMLTRNSALMKQFYEYHRKIILERRYSLSKLMYIVNEDGPYAWIQDEENKLESKGIIIKRGSIFGANDKFARFSLICDDTIFNTALKALE